MVFARGHYAKASGHYSAVSGKGQYKNRQLIAPAAIKDRVIVPPVFIVVGLEDVKHGLKARLSLNQAGDLSGGDRWP
jgi:hypothetical protein